MNIFFDNTRDDRYFVMRNSSKTTFPSITKRGYCQGNWVCPNKKCPFTDSLTGNFLARCTGRLLWRIQIEKCVEFVISMLFKGLV